MRRATTVLLSGALLAVGAPAGWYALADRGPEEFGGAAVERLAQPAAPASAPPAPPAVGTSSARLADLALPADPRADRPVEVRLAGQVVPVDRVGLDGQRRMVVPQDVRRAGWYEPGVPPGAETGSAVLAGHVDDREQGLGAFAEVRGLTAGDQIDVRTTSGRTLSYDVVSLEQFPKSEAPMERLFSTQGPHRLVLISCAGDFDPLTRSYADNVVVTAVPRS